MAKHSTRQEERKPPRAAFVIPAFEAEATLGESVESVLAQTEPDVEVVVVDNGSTDGTFDLACRMAREDSRILALRLARNRGPGGARNCGVLHTRARYLAFLDDDDLVLPGKVEAQAAFLDRTTSVGVVYSATETFSDPGAAGRRPFPVTTDGDVLARELLAGADRGFPLHAALVRREAFERVGGFRGRRPLVEDLDLWVRMARSGTRFAYLDAPAVLYRTREGSRSTKTAEVAEGRLAALTWLARRPPPGAGVELRRKARFRTLALADMQAAAGRSGAARRTLLTALRWGRSPGEILEVARLLFRLRDERVRPPG